MFTRVRQGAVISQGYPNVALTNQGEIGDSKLATGLTLKALYHQENFTQLTDPNRYFA